jgi:serine/threonine protein kinase
MTDATTAVTTVADLPDVGSLIADKFRLEELIGEGGQAWIWRARHLELDSEVAIKILRASNADETQIERLRKEARSVAKLNHPAIVRVFDLGDTPQGHPYFVMEHLEGENLAELLARDGKLDPIEAVRLLLPIAGAVAGVHAIGVVHRDLKPDNVFLARSAHAVQPKLLDFGVAKHEVQKGRQPKLTEVGAVLGSPAYLSPEQARGQADVDARADVWSFCAMLYECVTGTLPFHAENTHALLFSIAEDQPLSLADHGVEEDELWRILHRGLEKATTDRWPNMRTLGRALAQWLCDRGVTSDVSGVELESTWFNPELVTPPPIAPRRTESVGSDAPAWTKRSGAASHIESRAVDVPAKPQRHWRGKIAVTLTFLASAGAAVFFLTGTPLGTQKLRQLQHAGHRVGIAGRASRPEAAKSLGQFGTPPAQLQFEHLVRSSAALLPGLPYTLIPMPVVPVEKLRLVSAPAKRNVDTGTSPLMASPMSGAGTSASTAAASVPAATAPAKAAPAVEAR